MTLLRILSAILLLAVGGIHLFLRFDGTAGCSACCSCSTASRRSCSRSELFALRGTLLKLATVLSLLFLLASLASLLLALTVGLFGIHEAWTFTLVPQTVVVDAIGIVILAVTTVLTLRKSGTARI